MKLIEALKKAGIEAKVFKFRGHCIGRSQGFPEFKGTYDTVCHGELEKYLSGSDEVGEWILLREFYCSGCPEYPSNYSAIYVRKKDWKTAEEIRNSLGLARREEI